MVTHAYLFACLRQYPGLNFVGYTMIKTVSSLYTWITPICKWRGLDIPSIEKRKLSLEKTEHESVLRVVS